MKCEVVTKEEPKFEPIELKITLENKTDIAWLWAIANCTDEEARSHCQEGGKNLIEYLEEVGNPQMKFFNAINEIKQQHF